MIVITPYRTILLESWLLALSVAADGWTIVHRARLEDVAAEIAKRGVQA